MAYLVLKWNDTELISKYLSIHNSGSGVGIDFSGCSIAEYNVIMLNIKSTKESCQ